MFEDRNIRADREYVRELVGTYQSRATPTLVVNDRVVIGFDPAQYEAALRAAGGIELLG